MIRWAMVAALLFPLLSQAAPPTLTGLFPAGGQPGSSFKVQAFGTFEPWPVELVAATNTVRFSPDEKKGWYTVEIAADAPHGAIPVRLVQFLFTCSKVRSPMHVCLPGLTVKNETGAAGSCQAEETIEIAFHGFTPYRISKQGVGGELGDIDTIVEYQICFQTGIAKEKIAGKLWK